MRKEKAWRKKYRSARTRAHNVLERNAVAAVMEGRGLIDDQNGDGFVYVIRIGIGSLYKIGCSRDVKKRMKVLMAANPALSLVFAVRVKSRLASERALHTQFADRRRQGELFELSEADLELLAANFPNATEALNVDSLKTEPMARISGMRKCAKCGALFEPEKPYWKLCEVCGPGTKLNKTGAGWSRWRNLRTTTHLAGEG